MFDNVMYNCGFVESFSGQIRWVLYIFTAADLNDGYFYDLRASVVNYGWAVRQRLCKSW